jgi:hypothetical protein
MVTPGLSRATISASCHVRFVRIQGGNDAGIHMSISRDGMK